MENYINGTAYSRKGQWWMYIIVTGDLHIQLQKMVPAELKREKYRPQ